MLYRPEDFEPLTDEPWDEERIRAGIREIVADTDAALRGPKLLWRADDWDRWRATSPLKDLYCGAAGVLWALADLRERGHAETRWISAISRSACSNGTGRGLTWRAGRTFRSPASRRSSSGETGHPPRRVPARADLRARGRRSTRASARTSHNEADEIMWGSPGTMIAARLMLAWTGDERWRAAWDESADALLDRRDSEGLWTQLLHGHTVPVPRAGTRAHRERAIAPVPPRRQARGARCDGRLRRSSSETAVVENGLANWPPEPQDALENARGEIRLQWCHGAPGIVVAAAPYLDEELVARGRGAHLASRRASRRRREPGSATARRGTGTRCCTAFERTGDERWLERARRFAVHALAQVRRQRAARGRGRYSLCTGDLGVALYLATASTRVPRSRSSTPD